MACYASILIRSAAQRPTYTPLYLRPSPFNPHNLHCHHRRFSPTPFIRRADARQINGYSFGDMRYIIATSLGVIFGASAFAATVEVKVTGTYSSFTYNEESGDLGGTEISILYGAQAYYAVVQCAEGEPGTPVIVKVQVNGSRVSFTIPKDSASGCPEAAYTGTVSAVGLSGQFSGFGSPELLKRKKSYWQ